MKKVFSAIGVLLVIFSFSIYFMLTEQSTYFISYEDVYIIELNDEFMELQEMEEIATKNNVMLANRQILATGIGTTHVKHRVINPRKNVKEGIKKKINYI